MGCYGVRALGLLEVFGLTTALVAADAACKAGDVRIVTIDKNKPGNADKLEVPLLIVIKFEGTVSDVEMAIEAGIAAAKKVSGVSCSYIIPRVDEGIKGFVDTSCIG